MEPCQTKGRGIINALLTLLIKRQNFCGQPKEGAEGQGREEGKGREGSKGSQRTQKGSTKQQKSPQCLEMCEKIEWICMKFK